MVFSEYSKTVFKYKFCFWAIGVLFLITGCRNEIELSKLDYALSVANVKTEGINLIVNTGSVERTWELTSAGLRTKAFKDLKSGEVYSNKHSDILCDWSYYGLIDKDSKAKLLKLSASKSDDEGFTSEHIEVVAEFEYPEVETFLKYVIWVYPGAPGIRTQLFIKGNAGKFLNETMWDVAENVKFNLVQGKFHNNYKASAHAALSVAASTQDDQKVEYLISGLNRNHKYKIGFTWWDFDGSGIHQNVQVASVDGEKKFQLIKNAEIPNFKKDKAQPETIVLDLPLDVLLDGSFRIYFEKTKGEKATVSELFVCEEDGLNNPTFTDIEERFVELKKCLPVGNHIIGYLNCGNPITGEKLIPTGRVDYIPFQTNGYQAKFVGYFNDTQHRNKPETPLIKELEIEVGIDRVNNNWSNLVCLQKNNNGIVVVKESHKCVNQYGVDTGDFELMKDGLTNTGTSLFLHDILQDEYSWCWASWSILYEGGQDEMEMAIKEFDRIRYPVDKKRDIYIQANTWGSDRGREASHEENVLAEMLSQQDLGIEIQQIDDGWQSVSLRMLDEQERDKDQRADLEWHVRNDWYPEGWKNVVIKSKETGVRLGLWGAAQPITLNALKWNYDHGGFVTYKLDFADLGSHQRMNELMKKVRSFVKYTNHKVRVNWDLTENAPRYGYYWAKEYGCVYLENRKPKVPSNAVYIPSLVLRDIWQLSKYNNVNRFQTTIQNIDMVDRQLSDAFLHNHPYVLAIGLVGTPLFFQETHFYSDEARIQIKDLLKKYKAQRERMYEQFVFPICDVPNNSNWTGFQWIDTKKENGYLMVFRELNNLESEKQIELRFLKNKKLEINDLETGESTEANVSDNGKFSLKIETKAGFKFLRYKVL